MTEKLEQQQEQQEQQQEQLEQQQEQQEQQEQSNSRLYEIEIREGALADVPIWEEHKRGKNWFAEIEFDLKSPGGLKRKFWQLAKGPNFFYIIPDDLDYPVAVEFGADYFTSGKRRIPWRWYGVIVNVTREKVIFEKWKTAKGAIERARELKEKINRKEILRKKAEELQKELAKVLAELEIEESK